jgi:integrase
MSLATLTDETGQPIAYDAIAGKVKGKQVRRRFSAKRFGSAKRAEMAARAWLADEGARRVRDLRSGVALTDVTQAEVVKALRLLPAGASLSEAVRVYAAALRDGSITPWTFGQAVDAFLETKRLAHARPHYLRSLQASLGQARKAFGAAELDAISEEDLLEWLKTLGRGGRPLSAITTRNYRRDLCMLWRFAIARRHARANPALHLPQPKEEDKLVEILNPEEARRLLEAADRRIVPYLALGLFAGLRPFEALAGGTWDHGHVTVLGPHSKSRRNRHVTVSDNLRAWLQFAGGWPRMSYWTARDLVNEAKRKAGLSYGQDVYRHSFASHHLALHRSAALTAHEMGHRSQQMLYAKYHRLVTRAQALDYFAIHPGAAELP